MNRFFLPCFLPALSFSMLGCTTGDKFSMGGVPGWVADGAKLESEPEPLRPDPALIAHEDESGPVQFQWITDRRSYDSPPVKKTKKVSTTDPLERGRDARIRRLVR
ncbi:MAG: hypothetical protein JNJ70_09325 [Verrucomicrobiales bacterium]|nr:hypothetical protein [Verrucomicrobiales bacterium]